MKPGILLHICCAPCSLALISYLSEHDFAVTGFFYNPNIQPWDEYKRRLETAQDYFKKNKLPLISPRVDAPGYDEAFRRATAKDKQKPSRCQKCYELRLQKTARIAQAQGFKFFTTTLLASPHQDINLIRSLGDQLAQDYQIEFYYPDPGVKKFKGFRQIFSHSHELAQQEGLYRQNYCGCWASRQEAEETCL